MRHDEYTVYILIYNEALQKLRNGTELLKTIEFPKYTFEKFSVVLEVDLVDWGPFYSERYFLKARFINVDESLTKDDLRDFGSKFMELYGDEIKDTVTSFLKANGVYNVPSMFSSDYSPYMSYNLGEKLIECYARKMDESTKKGEFTVTKKVKNETLIAKIKDKDNIDKLIPEVYDALFVQFYEPRNIEVKADNASPEELYDYIMNNKN